MADQTEAATSFCAAREFNFSTSDCVCPEHYPAWVKQPHVQEGLRRAALVTECEDCPDEGKLPATHTVMLGASDDEGIEVFARVCDEHRMGY